MPMMPAVLGPTTRLNNFRLNYLPAQAAHDRLTQIRIRLGGLEVTGRVLYKSLTIRDLVFDAPNTCTLTFYGTTPTIGQSLEVWINSDAPQLLFNGEVQTVARTYKGRPSTVVHPVTAIDDTARANRRRPLRPYVNETATDIAQDLIATYAPGFSYAGVEGGLPRVSINFDGSEGGMKGCLTALAKLVGGYWYFENKTLYFFVTPPGNPPDPIDDTPNRFLHDPAITWAIDKSQVRTRVFGKGAGTRISASIAAATTLIPLDNAEMFNPAGGQAIAGQTPDGAASRVLTYTGVQLGGGGGLVGPGASPSAVPALSPMDGAGVTAGVHAYAFTFTTAAGESLPGPASSITVGVTAPPTAGPVAGTATTGGAVDAGSHVYGYTFVTSAGETTGSPGSGPITTAANVGGRTVAPPGPGPQAGFQQPAANGSHNGWNVGDVLSYAAVFVTATGTTTAGPRTNSVTASSSGAGGVRIMACFTAMTSDPAVTKKRLYRYRNGAPVGYFELSPGVESFDDAGSVGFAGSPPGTNTAIVPGTNYQTVPVSGIAIGPANVTARKLYRSFNGGTFLLVATIANNTATTFTDTIANSARGAAAPGANTATANQVRIVFAIGGSTVTGRKIYRTAAGQSQLQLLAIFPDNTQTIGIDTSPDAALGANAPTSDTSGLVQPAGQVPAGATSLILANPAPFDGAGGWAIIGNGDQVIRYTAKSASSLTGIPATGPGAIVASISYNSTVTAAPALVGVGGILDAIIRNSPIHVWVQRDDTAAQAAMVTLDGGGDGVYEHIWSDERRTEASLIQVCDAQLRLYSRPLVTVTYASRDLKTKSGKTVQITLASPAINESLTIQEVTITELGIRGLVPKFTVTAAQSHTTLESVLRMLMREAGA